MKNGSTLNKKQEGLNLYTVEFSPKGSKERIDIHVWAKNRLDASSQMIINKAYGTQHAITIKDTTWGEKL